MNLQGKKVLVVGLAQTGMAVAEFAHGRGARVMITDSKPRSAAEARAKAMEPFATLELGGHELATFTGADLIVMSPGVPELPETTAARNAGVPVIAEIELAYRFFDPEATLIAITGTNGKSTTTALTGALCEASGRPTFCGGNLGNFPLISAVDHPANSPGGLIVAEVAGFMLETCTSFRPKVAACLNITEDHLDRYGTMDVYASMKTRVYQWLEDSDFAVANADCKRTMAGARAASGRLMAFSRTQHVSPGASLDGDEIVLDLGGETERYPLSDLNLIGEHNQQNALAAYLCARLAGVRPQAIRKGAAAFQPLEHRMQRIAERDGVVYFDDSKGTNVDAVASSLRGFPQPVVLIAGGVDKGGSYVPMFEAMHGNTRALVLIGEAADLIEAAARKFEVSYPVVRATSMEDAVEKARQLAHSGDAVVLSPACSSYDMFKNFIERGKAFQAAVVALA